MASKKDFSTPDDSISFEKGRADVVRLGDATITLRTMEPGWRWSEHVGAIAKTDTCQVHHVGYVKSGTLHVVMDSGEEAEVTAGDAYDVAPGHDGWVVGDDTLELVEFEGAVR